MPSINGLAHWQMPMTVLLAGTILDPLDLAIPGKKKAKENRCEKGLEARKSPGLFPRQNRPKPRQERL